MRDHLDVLPQVPPHFTAPVGLVHELFVAVGPDIPREGGNLRAGGIIGKVAVMAATDLPHPSLEPMP